MDYLDLTSPFWDKFRAIALQNNFTPRPHPWESIGDSIESHFVAMLGWAIANIHPPLFSFWWDRDRPKLRKDVFNIPLNHYNSSPLLHLAARKSFMSAIEELLHVSKPNLLDHKGRLALHHAAETGSSVSIADAAEQTPLFIAAKQLNPYAVKLLIDRDAAIVIRDQFGSLPIESAVSSLLGVEATRGKSPLALLQAIKDDNESAAICLLQLGADPNRRWISDTPLHIAVQTGKLSTFGLLIQAGATIEYEQLHQAAQLGRTDVVKLLVASAEAIASANHHSPDLLRNKSSTKSPSLWGSKVLALAGLRNHAEIVTCLAKVTGEYQLDPDTIISILRDQNAALNWCIMEGEPRLDYSRPEMAPRLLLAIAAGAGNDQANGEYINCGLVEKKGGTGGS
ncbi:ankyrin repeat-containing domain protein [Aspergillus varians]